MCAYYYSEPFLHPYEKNHRNNNPFIEPMTINTRLQNTEYEIVHMSFYERLYYIFGIIGSVILIIYIILIDYI
jgi:hypothetical protein